MRESGLEPESKDWKSSILPLNYPRDSDDWLRSSDLLVNRDTLMGVPMSQARYLCATSLTESRVLPVNLF